MITPIARLEGTISQAGLDGVIVMVGGVGYGVHVPVTSLSRFRTGETVCLHTHFILREDGAALFGFLTEDERRLFETLIGVSGIGPRVALALLSAISPRDLMAAIAAGDVSALRRLPGVGPKMAGRLVLELHGSIEGAMTSAAPYSEDDAVAALVSLGYTAQEAVRALDGVGGETEERIRAALQRIGAGGSR